VTLLAAACRSTTTSSPPNLSSAVMVRAMPHDAWQLVDGEKVVGWIVRYETAVSGDRAYFSVRNVHQQELGVVDVDGRAWRYRAHQRDPEWIGTGTIAAGARDILGASETTLLVPVGLDRLGEAAAASAPR
jgi:hypothetical protein